MRRFTQIGALLTALAAAITLPLAFAADDSNLEYQVKAAYLYNFAKFIEWPTLDEHQPIILGVLGTDPFDEILDNTIAGKKINGHPVIAKRFSNIAQIHKCHILFVPKSESPHLAAILPAMASLGAITVGETDNFLQAGGVINFLLIDNKVHFEINPNPVQHAGVKISSQLLKLARGAR